MRDVKRERYYRDRAPVYDATSYRGDAEVDAGLDRETADIGALLAAISGERVLDVACGTGVWTRFLQGSVVAMDQSQEMLDIAGPRLPNATLVKALFPPLPFDADRFDTIFTANFYGLLHADERATFLTEAHRVGHELLVLDLRSDDDHPSEGIEERTIGNGRTYRIFRRRFTPESLRAELDGELLYEGAYFLLARVDSGSLARHAAQLR
jgi:ubiquinone/menaquinone biosynthesis C-methylase UbiE